MFLILLLNEKLAVPLLNTETNALDVLSFAIDDSFLRLRSPQFGHDVNDIMFLFIFDSCELLDVEEPTKIRRFFHRR